MFILPRGTTNLTLATWKGWMRNDRSWRYHTAL